MNKLFCIFALVAIAGCEPPPPSPPPPSVSVEQRIANGVDRMRAQRLRERFPYNSEVKIVGGEYSGIRGRVRKTSTLNVWIRTERIGSVLVNANYVEPLVYVDEADIPDIKGDGNKSGTEIMGEQYPHIVIDGCRLDYDARDKWYHFAHGGPRAMWMGFGGERILDTSDRSKNGENLNELTREIEMEEWCPKTHRWIPSKPLGPPVIPPRPQKQQSAQVIE